MSRKITSSWLNPPVSQTMWTVEAHWWVTDKGLGWFSGNSIILRCHSVQMEDCATFDKNPSVHYRDNALTRFEVTVTLSVDLQRQRSTDESQVSSFEKDPQSPLQILCS